MFVATLLQYSYGILLVDFVYGFVAFVLFVAGDCDHCGHSAAQKAQKYGYSSNCSGFGLCTDCDRAESLLFVFRVMLKCGNCL